MLSIPLSDWLRQTSDRLRLAGIEESDQEARLIAAHSLNRSLAWIAANGAEPVESKPLDELVVRREQREPLAYIIGSRGFYKNLFRVDRSVLIPRPETECLVEAALERAANCARVLDLCTGSGCVGVSVALERPDLTVVASDYSSEALDIARRNANALGAEVEFVRSDLFARIPSPEKFDLIVCNPPYVESDAPLEPEVGLWEPGEALYAGPDGMEFYRRIAAERPPAEILLEIGDGQLSRVVEVFAEEPSKVWNDLNGTERVVGFAP